MNNEVKSYDQNYAPASGFTLSVSYNFIHHIFGQIEEGPFFNIYGARTAKPIFKVQCSVLVLCFQEINKLNSQEVVVDFVALISIQYKMTDYHPRISHTEIDKRDISSVNRHR